MQASGLNTRESDTILMKEVDAFRTIVAPSSRPADIEPTDGLFFLGSCFADNVGAEVRRRLMVCCVNPYGTVYNPLSMAMQMSRIVNREPYEASEMVENGGEIHSWKAHSCLSAPTPDVLAQQIDDATRDAHEALKQSKMVCLTLGTAWVYELASTGRTVANCHKMPTQMFRRRLMQVGEVAECITGIVAQLRTIAPEARVVLTVSPIRHLRDGAHDNQISKSTLLLGIEQARNANPQLGIDYFPSFEIMMDDLRDYRFYADDMTHPSPVAVGYIYRAFAEAYFAEQTIAYAAEAIKIRQALDHRAQDANSVEYRRFAERTLAKAEALRQKYKIEQRNASLNSAIEELARRMG